MFDESLRDVKQIILMPFSRLLAGVPPSSISLFGFVLGLVGAYMLYQGQQWMGLALFAFNRIMDGVDGEVARATGRQTDFGGYLDILLDITIYIAIPLSLVAAAPTLSRLWALVFLMATYYINAASWMYLAAILEKRRQGAASRAEKTTVTMPSAIIGGLETMIFYALFILLPAQITLLFIIFDILVIISVIQRLLWSRRNL